MKNQYILYLINKQYLKKYMNCSQFFIAACPFPANKAPHNYCHFSDISVCFVSDTSVKPSSKIIFNLLSACSIQADWNTDNYFINRSKQRKWGKNHPESFPCPPDIPCYAQLQGNVANLSLD